MLARNLSRAIAAVGIVLAAVSARATDYNYNYFTLAGTATGDYNTASNWSGGIPVSSGGTDTINVGVIYGGLTATLASDASASIPDVLNVGYSPNQQLAGSNGTLNLTDPAASLSVGNTYLVSQELLSGVYVGYDGIGAMSVSAGSVTVNGTFDLGRDSGPSVSCSPTGMLTQTGGTINVTGRVLSNITGNYVGGDFNVGDGLDGSSGSFMMSGGSLSVASQLNIGRSISTSSAGTVTQTGGTITVAALRMNSSATYNMSGNSSLTTGTTTVASLIGGPGINGASSTFNQTGGTVSWGKFLYVGYQSPGTYNVNGATVNFISPTANFKVGNGLNSNAVGTVHVSNGGRLTCNALAGKIWIGGESGGSGVTVEGTGSSFSASSTNALAYVRVGNYADGYLTVKDNASATIGRLFAGASRHSTTVASKINVTSGGTLSVAGANYIGSGGDCVATVDGGLYQVTGTATTTYIGFVDSSSTANIAGGTLTVKGTGVFSGGARLYIGSGSAYGDVSGVVNVQDNAVLTTPVILVGASGGTAMFNQSGGTVNPGSDINGSGTFNLTGGLLNMNGFNFSVSEFNFSGGSISNVAYVNSNVVLPSGGNANFYQQNADYPGFVTGKISGSGGLTKLGDGPLTINTPSSGTNSYTGKTSIKAGVLSFVGPNAWDPVVNLGGAYLSGGSLVFDYSTSGLTSTQAYDLVDGLLGSKIAAWKPFAPLANDGTTIAVSMMDLLAGDLDGNGTVNSTDLGLLLSHYNQTFAAYTNNTWGDGDGNGDGTVNSTDLGLLLSHYNQTGYGATSAVPEPSTVLLAAAGLISLLAYAWRKK